MSAEPNGWHVLRDQDGTLHFPREGRPSCGFVGTVTDAIHPSDRAAIWCTNCLTAAASRGHDRKGNRGA